jgi:DNA polymerase (family 10)
VLAAAARTGTAIEVNASLSRLDAATDVLRRARAHDVTIVVNSDAHHRREFDRLRWGALHAQRGWVDRDRIANTWPAQRFLAWVSANRAQAG